MLHTKLEGVNVIDEEAQSLEVFWCTLGYDH
jgi:hypothetical protein